MGDDEQYDEFLASLVSTFQRRTSGAKALFRTNAGALFKSFLAALPEERRQHYTCHACSSFVQRFGSLVVVNDDGSRMPAIWDSEVAPNFFRASDVVPSMRAKTLGKTG